MREKTAWDEAVDEGMLKGGLRALLAIGRTRFGKPDAKTEAALGAIKDLDRMADAIPSVKSWKALLAIQ